MKNIALFGSSADPPTTGHQTIINWLSQHFDWVAVWAANNPFKSHQTPLEHRLEMLRLLVEEITPYRHNIGVYPELSNPRTLTTVHLARSKWPDAILTLAIGSDLVTQIQQWYRVKELLQQVHLLVVPRPGYAVNDFGLEQLGQLGAKVAIADLQAPPVSSTAYRKLGQIEALTPPIQAYIHREHLYPRQDAI